MTAVRHDDNLRHRAGLRVDLWLAMLAGPLPWTDPDRRASGLESATVAAQAVAVASVVTWPALDSGQGGPYRAALLESTG